MIGERVPEGFLVRLKPAGIARIVPAVFLSFWLCGWAFGECFAIGALAKGLTAVMNGTPFEEGQNAFGLGFGVAAGAFLLFWLVLWTLGGIAAMAELLRLVWSEDRIIANAAGLTLDRSLGPFRFRREFPRDELVRITPGPRNGGIGVETTKGRFLLSRNCGPDARDEAIQALHAELGLRSATPVPDPGSETGAVSTAEAVDLPKGWQEVVTPEGERALVVDLATRMKQARVVAGIAFVMVAVAILSAAQLRSGLAMLPFAIITTLMALALCWGAVWLSRGRMEWRIGSGRVTLRHRFGSEVKDVFEGVRLELGVKADSDSGDWYVLDALNDSAPSGPASSRQELRLQWKSRRRVAAVPRDRLVALQLGSWLARAAGIPFRDGTTPEARQAEMDLLRDQLAQSGPLGRAAARLIANADQERRKSA